MVEMRFGVPECSSRLDQRTPVGVADAAASANAVFRRELTAVLTEAALGDALARRAGGG
jgi:hypothetical protein